MSGSVVVPSSAVRIEPWACETLSQRTERCVCLERAGTEPEVDPLELTGSVGSICSLPEVTLNQSRTYS